MELTATGAGGPDRVRADGGVPRGDAGPADPRRPAGRGGRPGAGRGRPAGRGSRCAARVHRPGRGARRSGGGRGRDRGAGPVPRRPGGGRGRCGQGGVLREADGAARRPTPTGRSTRPAPPASCCRSGSTGGSPPDWRPPAALLDDGRLGTPRLLRSVTRDPGGFDPSRVAPDTIFNETLIHDFDTLRFLNPGAEPVEVYATADALVEPAWRDRGLLDTAVVVVRFDNGAVGVAEACFEAAYGYDVRGEVLRLRRHGHHGRRPAQRDGVLRRGRPGRRDRAQRPGAAGRRLRRRAGRLRRRRAARRTGGGGRRGRPGRAGHRAGRGRVGPRRPPGRGSTRWPSERRSGWRSAPRWCSWSCRSSSGSGASPTSGSRSRSGTGRRKDIDALAATGATFSSMTGYITGTLADPDGADGAAAHRRAVAEGRRAAGLPAAQPARHRPRRPGPAGAGRARPVTRRCG